MTLYIALVSATFCCRPINTEQPVLGLVFHIGCLIKEFKVIFLFLNNDIQGQVFT